MKNNIKYSSPCIMLCALQSCPPGLRYNAKSTTCDWPENVDCGSAKSFLQASNPQGWSGISTSGQLDNSLKPTFYGSG